MEAEQLCSAPGVVSLVQQQRKAADTEDGRKVVVPAAAPRAELAARGWAGPQAPEGIGPAGRSQLSRAKALPSRRVPHLPNAARQRKPGAGKQIHENGWIKTGSSVIHPSIQRN